LKMFGSDSSDVPLALKHVEINGGSSIADSAFKGCGGIESVSIPASVSVIESNAFFNCTGLKNVYYEGTAEEWADIPYCTPSRGDCSFWR